MKVETKPSWGTMGTNTRRKAGGYVGKIFLSVLYSRIRMTLLSQSHNNEYTPIKTKEAWKLTVGGDLLKAVFTVWRGPGQYQEISIVRVYILPTRTLVVSVGGSKHFIQLSS